MTGRQASMILALLEAAYPTRQDRTPTLALWKTKLEPLDYETASLAVGDLIDHIAFWPSIAEFRDAYRRRRPATKPEPPEAPELSERERQENLERIQTLMKTIGWAA